MYLAYNLHLFFMVCTMKLFKSLHKTPFWSQFLLGIFAILSVAEIQLPTQSPEQTVINQTIEQSALAENEQTQQAIFLSEFKQEIPTTEIQAVEFSKFFAKSYRFDGDLNQPIRAGPLLS